MRRYLMLLGRLQHRPWWVCGLALAPFLAGWDGHTEGVGFSHNCTNRCSFPVPALQGVSQGQNTHTHTRGDTITQQFTISSKFRAMTVVLCRNYGNQLPAYDAQHPRRTKASNSDQPLHQRETICFYNQKHRAYCAVPVG
jgi:hypothetical protein